MIKNYIGERFTSLIVVKQYKVNNRTWLTCKCDCGNELDFYLSERLVRTCCVQCSNSKKRKTEDQHKAKCKERNIRKLAKLKGITPDEYERLSANRLLPRFCTVEGCVENHTAKGLCELHYSRYYGNRPIIGEKYSNIDRSSYLDLCKCGSNKKKEETICWGCKQKEEPQMIKRRARERKRVVSSDRKLDRSLRRRFNKVYGGSGNSKSVISMLGCSIEELKIYLTSKFYSHPETNDIRYPAVGYEMTLDNYGSGYDKWHIDHIIPLCSIKKPTKQQLESLWHYTNLQPLWSYDNLRKGSK